MPANGRSIWTSVSSKCGARSDQKATSKFPFHDWYLGALAAVAQAENVNPDRLAQAANSLREILEKIPRALETEVSGADRNILERSRKSAATAITQARADYQNGWAGEITQPLKAALEQVDRTGAAAPGWGPSGPPPRERPGPGPLALS
jgi:hypothetical protein